MYIQNPYRYVSEDINIIENFDNISLVNTSITLQTNTFGFAINSNGTKLFIVSNSLKKLYQYSFSVAYDASTISYDSVSYSVTTVNKPRGVTINDTDDRLYVVGDNFLLQEIDLATPNDLSTASHGNSLGLGGKFTSIDLKDNGNNFLIASTVYPTSDSATQYDASTPYSVVGATLNITKNTQAGFPYSAIWLNNGNELIVGESSADKLYIEEITSAYSLSTIQAGSRDNHILTDGTGEIIDLGVNPTQEHVYVLRLGSKKIYQYTLI